jgi:hypothetical protein
VFSVSNTKYHILCSRIQDTKQFDEEWWQTLNNCTKYCI